MSMIQSIGSTSAVPNQLNGMTVTQTWMDKLQGLWIGSEVFAHHIICWGDSTVQGSVGGFDNWVNLLRRMLTNQSPFGVNPLAIAKLGPGWTGWWNQWVTLSGTWTSPAANVTALGPYNSAQGAAGSSSNIISITPDSFANTSNAQNIGQLQIFLAQGAGAAAEVSTSVDNGATWQALTGIATTGSPSVFQAIINLASQPTANTVKIRAADHTGAAAAILGFYGVELIQSQVAGFSTGYHIDNIGKNSDFLFNVGQPIVGSGSITIIDNATSTGAGEVALVIVGPYTNDVEFDTSTNYGNNMAAMINHYPNVPVLIIGAWERNDIIIPPQTAFRAAAQNAAANNNAAFLDMRARWGPFAQANASGFMQPDSVHETQLGHLDIASTIYRLLRTLG